MRNCPGEMIAQQIRQGMRAGITGVLALEIGYNMIPTESPNLTAHQNIRVNPWLALNFSFCTFLQFLALSISGLTVTNARPLSLAAHPLLFNTRAVLSDSK